MHPHDSRALAYWAQLSVLNQIVVISQQLRDDVNNMANHKYIAHQLALLYVCMYVCMCVCCYGFPHVAQQGVIQCGGAIKGYKDDIEVRASATVHTSPKLTRIETICRREGGVPGEEQRGAAAADAGAQAVGHGVDGADHVGHSRAAPRGLVDDGRGGRHGVSRPPRETKRLSNAVARAPT